MTGRHPYLRHDGPVALAHRGGKPAQFENTWRAFQQAVDLGYTYVETDVRATADGEIVTFHDPDVRRVSGRAGLIREMDYETLAAVRIGGSEQIPRLREVLTEYPHVQWNIDIKERAALEPTLRILNAHQAWDRVCLASFSDFRLAAMRKLSENPYCMSAGPLEFAAFTLSRTLPLVKLPGKWLRADVLQIPVAQSGIPLITPGLLRTAHRAGVAVHAWVINSPAQMADLLDLGVDGIITDETEQLKELMQSRGQWP